MLLFMTAKSCPRDKPFATLATLLRPINNEEEITQNT